MIAAPLQLHLQCGLVLQLSAMLVGRSPMILCSVYARGPLPAAASMLTSASPANVNAAADAANGTTRAPALFIGGSVAFLDSTEQAAAAQAWIDHFRATLGHPERVELEVPA